MCNQRKSAAFQLSVRHVLQGNFVTTDGSEYALKEALFTKGPMTVSVDAAPDSFVFYSRGIYNNSACRSDYKGEHSPPHHCIVDLWCAVHL